MIIIKRDTWFMKFYMSTNDFLPENLCQFIRRFMLAVFLWVFIIVLGCCIALGVSVPLLYLFFDIPGPIMGAVLIVDGAILSVVLRGLRKDRVIKDSWLFINVTPKMPSLPHVGFFGLLYKYIKAIHDKTCPLIKVEW